MHVEHCNGGGGERCDGVCGDGVVVIVIVILMVVVVELVVISVMMASSGDAFLSNHHTPQPDHFYISPSLSNSSPYSFLFMFITLVSSMFNCSAYSFDIHSERGVCRGLDLFVDTQTGPVEIPYITITNLGVYIKIQR